MITTEVKKENEKRIPENQFKREVESILRQSIASDYVDTILYSDVGDGNTTVFEMIREDVETSSAWKSEQWYNGDDIKLAIGRTLLRLLMNE